MDKKDKLFIPSLKLVSDDDLLSEIACRWDSFVFSGVKDDDNVSPEDKMSEPIRCWEGDDIMCRGLCMELIEFIGTYGVADDDDEGSSDTQC